MSFSPAFEAATQKFERTHRNQRSPRWEMYRRICEAVVIGGMIERGELEADGQSYLSEKQGTALVEALMVQSNA